jgi:hypothetical protein
MQFTEDEWETLQQICAHLEKFDEASKLMSGENYPTLSYVIPIFIELFSYIERHVANAEDENPMKDALTATHAVLSKYYSFTDDSSYYKKGRIC